MKNLRFKPHWFIGLGIAAALSGCGDNILPEPMRLQDTRTFTPPSASVTTFAALPAAAGDTTDMATTSRWAGVLGGAGYKVEVPANWNGKLVMYAHGYAGEGANLVVQDPAIRRHLLNKGYAWAASSYSKNYYDVRAGVEDTNALANAFVSIAAKNGRKLAEPSKRFIMGVSMGGHITGAAIEAETAQTANNKTQYAAALPMCGVMGDTELFNQFAAMQVTAQTLAPVPTTPTHKWSTIENAVRTAIFDNWSDPLNPPQKLNLTEIVGAQYFSVLRNITGGDRPLVDLGLAVGGSFPLAWGRFGSDGTINGILAENVLDTTAYTYKIDNDAAGSAALNDKAPKLTAVPDANRLRRDGLRWVPKVNGQFSVPVLSIHTLGDLFVPFSMQQTYAKRAAANGNGAKLVQRAIRGISHCDFTQAEMTTAFDDLIAWEAGGAKPAGDDVLNPDVVKARSYGCTHTKNTLGPNDAGHVTQLRPLAAQFAPCP